MKWLKDRLGWVVSLLTGLLSLGAVGYFIRKKMLASEKRAELEATTARARILEERRRNLRTLVAEDDIQIQKMDKRLADVRRQAVSVLSEVEEMTDEEVLRRFEQLGY